MNTLMTSSSANDSHHFRTARHTFISASPPPQDDLLSRTVWHCTPGLCSSDAHNHISFARNVDVAPRSSVLQASNAPQNIRHTVFNKPYPSPPLTGSALRLTVPLPDLTGDASTDYSMRNNTGDGAQHEDISHDMIHVREPLSPPPSHLLGTLDLPDVDMASDLDTSDFSAGLGSSSQYSLLDAAESHRPMARHTSPRHGKTARVIHHCEWPAESSRNVEPSVSPSRGWSFEGTLTDLHMASEHANVQTHLSPLRADSGFEESLSHKKSDIHKLPRLAEHPSVPFSRIEPSAYWTPTSPLCMNGSLTLDDHLSTNPAVARGDYRHDSVFTVSLVEGSHSDSTPSWSSCSTASERDSDYSPPASPRHKSFSLDLPDLDHAPAMRSDFDEITDPYNDRASYTGLLDEQPRLPWQGLSGRHEATRHHDLQDIMDIDGEPPPSSPRPRSIFLPQFYSDSDESFADTVIPSEDNSWAPSLASPSPMRHDFLDLQSMYNDEVCITPIPRSPHGQLAILPDLNMDEPLEVPPSPSSPHLSLPDLPNELPPPPTDEYWSSGTVAPSLVAPPPADHEGLGLFLQPVSVDPPLARSPSPDDDDLQFLDVQLDPTSSNLEVDEFLQLRAIRRRALSAERAARVAEAEFGERVSIAADALLPPAQMHTDAYALDDDEKRARKHELHVAMDMRAEARRVRKLEKQRSKEVGALLDLKMERGVAPGKGAMRSIAQLVANMVLRRRDAFRPLTNRKADVLPRPYVRTALYACVSAEDLLLGEADVDVDMVMGEE